MPIKINNVEYLSYEEQVAKNKQEIEKLKNKITEQESYIEELIEANETLETEIKNVYGVEIHDYGNGLSSGAIRRFRVIYNGNYTVNKIEYSIMFYTDFDAQNIMLHLYGGVVDDAILEIETFKWYKVVYDNGQLEDKENYYLKIFDENNEVIIEGKYTMFGMPDLVMHEFCEVIYKNIKVW